jgi:hypothetical protein
MIPGDLARIAIHVRLRFLALIVTGGLARSLRLTAASLRVRRERVC